jgi:hypothetical protein
MTGLPLEIDIETLTGDTGIYRFSALVAGPRGGVFILQKHVIDAMFRRP